MPKNTIEVYLADETLQELNIRSRNLGMSRSVYIESLIKKEQLLQPLSELSLGTIPKESDLKDRLDDIINEEKKQLGIPEESEGVKNEKNRRSYF